MDENIKINKYLDHTYHKRDTTHAEMDEVIEQVKKYNFGGFCVQSVWVKYVAEKLQGTGINVVPVIGFPYGQVKTEVKIFEAKEAIKDGATECDFVVNVSAIHERDTEYLEREFTMIREATKGTTIKMIFEVGLLTLEEAEYAAKLAIKAGFDFIKTSTAVQTTGATPETVQLFVDIAHPAGKRVKASGGIRTYEDAVKYIKMGADRLGTSNGIQIINGETGTHEY